MLASVHENGPYGARGHQAAGMKKRPDIIRPFLFCEDTQI